MPITWNYLSSWPQLDSPGVAGLLPGPGAGEHVLALLFEAILIFMSKRPEWGAKEFGGDGAEPGSGRECPLTAEPDPGEFRIL